MVWVRMLARFHRHPSQQLSQWAPQVSRKVSLQNSKADSSDSISSFSNVGHCVDMYAPGVGIKSAWIGSTTATKELDGTSMSTPFVAGVAALYLQDHTRAGAFEISAWLKQQAVPLADGNQLVHSPLQSVASPLPNVASQVAVWSWIWMCILFCVWSWGL